VKRHTHAFTLAELLLALAISSVLILLLVNVVSAALNVWQQGRNQIDTLASARQALGRIADEIKGAIASAAPNQIEFSENVASLSTTTPGTSENVFFVAPYPNSAAGDLCVIAYRHNTTNRELERTFLHSQSAWTGAPKYQAAGYAILQSPPQWRTVAKGVLEFEIQSYSQADLDAASPTSTPGAWTSLSATAPMAGNTPREVVIRMKMIDEKALARIAGLSPGNAVYDRTVIQNAREFTVSVLLPHAH
jgi:prepilin-type N-terminal cleavage/methylation domain-containing protein